MASDSQGNDGNYCPAPKRSPRGNSEFESISLSSQHSAEGLSTSSITRASTSASQGDQGKLPDTRLSSSCLLPNCLPTRKFKVYPLTKTSSVSSQQTSITSPKLGVAPKGDSSAGEDSEAPEAHSNTSASHVGSTSQRSIPSTRCNHMQKVSPFGKMPKATNRTTLDKDEDQLKNK